MKKRTHLSIRMDAELLYLIRKCVSDFEKENGPIPVEKEDSPQ